MDRWIGNLSLELRFPRTFSLAIKKKERSLNSGIGLMVSGLGTSNSQDQPLIGKSNNGRSSCSIVLRYERSSRNEMIFNNKIWDRFQVIDVIFARVAWWFKAKWPDSKASFDDILRFPHC
ncbi:hypothetical protein PVK06_014698 [Gossypium arboreum]|uniref:Uncharacterized protein n=1 Tax=Gossypium arboreum TaxID=29729 RepID=A0ABR0PW33_GOSAR|nr:hypothetical protein PVK06_014698 [Gossypium arboreum]